MPSKPSYSLSAPKNRQSNDGNDLNEREVENRLVDASAIMADLAGAHRRDLFFHSAGEDDPYKRFSKTSNSKKRSSAANKR